MFEEAFARAEKLSVHAREYIHSKIDSVKLETAEKSSKLVSGVFTGIVMLLLLMSFFLFINISLAYLIGGWIGKTWAGFLIVSGFYLAVGAFIWFFREKLIRVPITNKILSLFFDKNAGDEEN